jgi:hypothetical protein
LRRKQIHCHWFAFGDGRKDGRAKGWECVLKGKGRMSWRKDTTANSMAVQCERKMDWVGCRFQTGIHKDVKERKHTGLWWQRWVMGFQVGQKEREDKMGEAQLRGRIPRLPVQEDWVSGLILKIYHEEAVSP